MRLVAVAVIVIAIAGAVGLASMLLAGGDEPSDYLLLGEPDTGGFGPYDMYLVREGAEVANENRIARGVNPNYITIIDDFISRESRNRAIAALPSGDLAVGYFSGEESEESVVVIGNPTDWETTSFEFEASSPSAYYERGTNGVVVIEYDADQRCYTLLPGERADRLTRSEMSCSVSLTIGVVRVVEQVSENEFNVVVSDLAGNTLTELRGLPSSSTAINAEQIFYIDGRPGDVELVTVEWQSGAEVARSDSYSSIKILDQNGDAVVFAGDDGDGSLDLSVIKDGGEAQVIAQAPAVDALLSANGGWVFYATADDDGDWDVFGRSIDALPGDEIDLDLSGSDMQSLFMYSPFPEESDDPFLLVQTYDQEETDVYGGTPATGLTFLYTSTQAPWYDTPGVMGSRAFLGGVSSFSSEDAPLYIYDIQTASLVEIDERWDGARWVDATEGGEALIIATDGDEYILYFVEAGTDPDVVELDNADRISFAAFSSDTKTVWFSVVDRGDAEVRNVVIADDPDPATIYEDTALLGTAWDRGFDSARSSSSASAFIDEIAAACLADGLDVIEYGETTTINAGLVSGTYDTCVTIREETDFEVTAISNNGTDLTLRVVGEYDLGFNDDYDGTDPYVRLDGLPAGTYRVLIAAFDQDTWDANFTLVTAPVGYSEATS